MKKIKTMISLFVLASVLLTGAVCAAEATAKIKLDNGATILVKEDYKMDIISINILFKVGLRQEDSDTFGATNIIKSLLFKNPSSSFDTIDNLEYLGAVTLIDSTPDYIQIECKTTRENFSKCLDIISNGLMNQKFDAQDINEVKEKTLKVLSDPNPFGSIYDYFLRNFYQNHPYKYIRLGTSTAIKNINADILNGFYKKYFSANNMVVSVCGNIAKTDALKELAQKFKNLKHQELGLKKIDWEPPSKENTIFLGLKANVAWVMIGFPAPSFKSPDYAAMFFIQNYLAEGVNSVIWTQIREKEGLAYDLGGSFPRLEGPSHFIVYVITEPDKSWLCKKKILDEVNKLKAVPLDYKTLRLVKEKMLSKYMLERERVSSQATNIAVDEIMDLNYTFDEKLASKINELTPSEIQKAANDYLFNPTIIIAKPSMYIQDLF